MNTSIKLYQHNQKSNTIKANGLAPVIGYEPWALRTIDSIKQTICDDIPVLIRVHPAADYPCSNEEDSYKLDMASHALLIVGYDDEKFQLALAYVKHPILSWIVGFPTTSKEHRKFSEMDMVSFAHSKCL